MRAERFQQSEESISFFHASFRGREFLKMSSSQFRPKLLLIALLTLFCITTAVWASHRAPQAPGPTATVTNSQEKVHPLALLLTPDNGPDTLLYRVEVGHPLPSSTTVMHHLPDAAVKGAVLPDGEVVAIADYEPGQDRSFGSALFRFVPGGTAVLLANHIAFASRPLVTPDGRVFVSRGSAGPASEGTMRVDALSIDEVNPRTGAVKTVWRSNGYAAYLAAAFGQSLVIYDVRPNLARLLLVNRDTGQEKILVSSLPPFASSFSMTDAGDLIFQDRDPVHDLWAIERLNLTSGNLDILQENRESLGPRAWPHGEVTWSAADGLQQVGQSPSPRALRENVDITAVAPEGTMAAAIAYSSSSSQAAIVVLDASGTELGRLTLPPRVRFDVGGFLP